MLVLITSCGRHDLLKETINSFLKTNLFENGLRLLIHEDMELKNEDEEMSVLRNLAGFGNIKFTKKIGQHKSIEKFLLENDAKYYVHLEDDWLFNNSYDWISDSVKIMEADDKIIKVLCREDSQHPCIYDKELNGNKYGYLQRNWHHEGITWQGFSWNPGVTRLDLLKQFVPFRKWEQDVAEDIANAGYKVAELEKKIYIHIGNNRSTHE